MGYMGSHILIHPKPSFIYLRGVTCGHSIFVRHHEELRLAADHDFPMLGVEWGQWL